MSDPNDVAELPSWAVLMLLIGGMALMLTGAGAIPADASKFHAPHWVVFVAGLAFSTAAVISLLARQRRQHPARYVFAVAVMVTCMFAVSVAASIYASGAAIAFGPFMVRGPAADAITRIAFGVGALVLCVLVLMVWRSWYRALREPAKT